MSSVSPSSNASKPTTTSNTSDGISDSEMKQIKKKLLNLDTSNDDVIDTIRKAMKDASTEDQFAIQQLMEMRSQISSAMTNILRSLYEASQNIISNMR